MGLLPGTKTTTPLSRPSFSGLSAYSDPTRGECKGLSGGLSTFCWEDPGGEGMAAIPWCISEGICEKTTGHAIAIVGARPGGSNAEGLNEGGEVRHQMVKKALRQRENQINKNHKGQKNNLIAIAHGADS